ncbi:hypothetical protein ACXM5X_10375 [Pseudomonas saponiphila]
MDNPQLRNMLRSYLWISLCIGRGNGVAAWPASRCARSCAALRNMLRSFPGISSKNAANHGEKLDNLLIQNN